MILINGNWEQVNNLQDVIRVVGEYYNDELAKAMESLLPEYSEEERIRGINSAALNPP